jgi:tetratricopeptide (TPR) repeat protein
MAMAAYSSSEAREKVLQQLDSEFAAHQLRVERLACADCRPDELVNRILECQADVIQVLDPDRVLFGEQNDRSPAWINFHREKLVERPGVQIWWMPPSAVVRFGQELPDLNRFFLFREDLTEAPASERFELVDTPGIGYPEGEADTNRGPDLLERALRAAEGGADGRRIWLELGIPALRAYLRSGQHANVLAALDRLTQTLGEPEDALLRSDDNASSVERGRAFASLADLHYSGARRTVNPTASLNRAIADYEHASRLLSDGEVPIEWARVQNGLGNSYLKLSLGGDPENVHHAIEYFQAALTKFPKSEFPEYWATTQRNLGVAYFQFSSVQDAQPALTHFEAALGIFTENTHPSQWAMIQYARGLSYTRLPTGDRLANIHQAIECYHSTLRFWTEQQFPEDWARVQDVLGNAYLQLGRSNLQQAIAYYKAALRIRTQSPQSWALTQQSLGFAYSQLPEGDRAENLRRAIECYEAALTVRTPDALPEEHKFTQSLLDTARAELAKLSTVDA